MKIFKKASILLLSVFVFTAFTFQPQVTYAQNISTEQLIEILTILKIIKPEQADLIRLILSSTKTQKPSASLKADRYEIDQGGSVPITWSSINTSSCYSDSDKFETYGKTAGAVIVSPEVTTLYELECRGSDNSVIKSNITVKVNKPTASPQAQIFTTDINKSNAVPYGGSIGILWQSKNAVKCTALAPKNFVAKGPINSTWGSHQTGPLYKDTTYTIECENSLGDKNVGSVTVYVESY